MTDVRLPDRLHDSTHLALHGTRRREIRHVHTCLYIDGTATKRLDARGPPASGVVVLQHDEQGILQLVGFCSFVVHIGSADESSH